MSLPRLCALASLISLTALLTVGTPAQAGDAAARKALGFSPDGTIFAFEQYSTLYDSTENVVEIQIIDTRTDTFVKGSPFSVRTKDDDERERELDAVRAELLKRAEPTLARLKVGETGEHLPGKPSIDLDEVGIYQLAKDPLAKTQEITLAGGRKAKLTIAETAFGKSSCYGAGGRGTFGDVIVQGLTLTLTMDDGASMILQMDKRLPKSRRCVTAYGLAEAWLHEAADGTQTLAVLIETVDAHEFHAGPNRRFMAVTKRLPR
jgi:predicted secreted protein